MLDFYSQFNPSPLSIKQFYEFGEYFCQFLALSDDILWMQRIEKRLE